MHNVALDDIVSIVREAGKIAMDFYDRDYTIKQKQGKGPVTDADMAVNEYLADALAVYKYPILSEESEDDRRRLDVEYVWIIDPIDGTKDFIQKTGEFTIMVALVHEGRSVMGVVYAPASDELFYAQYGKGAFKQHAEVNKSIHVSRKTLNGARILVSRNHLGDVEQKIAQKYQMEQTPMGSGGLKMSRIAEGRAELYINSSDKSSQWDICAGDVILTEAGGVIKSFHGREDIGYNEEDVVMRDGYITASSYDVLNGIE